jgi:4-hydroxybenzoate polyprenyltransferase
MEIPLQITTEAQGAFRQIQRFQKSSSPLLILALLAAPFVGTLLGLLHISSLSGMPLENSLWALPISVLIVIVHYYQHRALHRRSVEAQKRLELLRNQHGSEIDAVAKA